MRWGSGDAQFVRPVHGVVMLHGERIVPGSVLGIAAARSTAGHRFMGSPAISLSSADEYEERLAKEGNVIARFAARRADVDRQIEVAGGGEKADMRGSAPLLREITTPSAFPQDSPGGHAA